MGVQKQRPQRCPTGASSQKPVHANHARPANQSRLGSQPTYGMGDLWKAAEEGEFGDELDVLVDQADVKWENRDAILFAIDCRPSMLSSENFENSTVLSALKCVVTTMQNKIISSPDDLVGLVLFNTTVDSNVSNFKGIFSVFDLEPMDAGKIKKLQSWITSPQDLVDAIGSADDSAMIGNVLWLAANILGSKKVKAGSKRIFFFTDQDDPHHGNINMQRAIKTRSRDLRDLGIAFELFGISHVHGSDDKKGFDLNPFWLDVLLLFGGDEDELQSISESYASESTEKLEELMTKVRRREAKKRALARMKLELLPGVRISVKLFSLFLETKKANYVWVDGESGELMTPHTEWIRSDTGGVLQKVEMKHYNELGGAKAIFTKEELTEMRNFGPPGLTLIGFKDASFMKNYYNLTHSTFVYPDEFEIRGSILTFIALLETMTKGDKIALAKYIARNGAPPKLVALLPQAETVDEAGNQIDPPGFNMIILPFSDEIRHPKSPSHDHRADPMNQDATEEQVQKMAELVDKLKLGSGFDPLNYENPALQKHYAYLQALALEQDEPDPVTDTTLPNYEAIAKRAGPIVTSLAFPEPSAPSTAAKSKRPTTPAPAATSKKTKGVEGEAAAPTADISTITDESLLKKRTVAELKDYLTSVGIKPERLKPDLIQQVLAHNSKSVQS